MAYNGWSNYQTWAVKLWIDNEQGLYDEVNDLISRSNEKDAYNLSKKIQALVMESCPDIPCSMWSDLLNSAISEVDWHEISKSMIADWLAENPEDEPIESYGSEGYEVSV